MMLNSAELSRDEQIFFDCKPRARSLMGIGFRKFRKFDPSFVVGEVGNHEGGSTLGIPDAICTLELL
eukprot:598852-Rhodomonas_salina.1